MDIMVTFSLYSSEDISLELAQRARERRLNARLTQEGLSQRSGVALGTLKKFEKTGQISLVSFIRLAVTLKDDAALENLLKPMEFQSMDQLLDKPKHKRGKIT